MDEFRQNGDEMLKFNYMGQWYDGGGMAGVCRLDGKGGKIWRMCVFL